MHGLDHGPVHNQDERAPQKSEYDRCDEIDRRLVLCPLTGARVGYDEYGVVHGEHHGQDCDRGRPEHDRADADEGASFRVDVFEDLDICSAEGGKEVRYPFLGGFVRGLFLHDEKGLSVRVIKKRVAVE